MEYMCRRFSVGLLAVVLLAFAGGCGGEEPDQAVPPKVGQYLGEAYQAFRVGAYYPALVLADSAAHYGPDIAVVHYTRGRILAELEYYAEAEEAYGRALQLEPEFASARLNRANIAFRRERYREALDGYEFVLERVIASPEEAAIYEDDPDGRVARHAVMLQIGRTYASLGAADSARQFYDDALAVKENSAEALHAIAELYEEQGVFEEALSYARQALGAAPEQADYRYAVGSLLLQSGRPADAIDPLRQVLAQDQGHRGAHYSLGRALVLTGREEEGSWHLAASDSLQQLESEIGELAETATVNQYRAQPWLEYADALRSAGRLEEAMRAYERAQALMPWNPALENNLGILATELGDTAQAIARYRAILRRDSTLADVWFNLGTVYARTGRQDDAREAWRQTLRHRPSHEEAKALLASFDG